MDFAYIFDFDGVLVNTMAMHFAAYQGALERVGVPIDREQFYRQAGMTGREQIRYFAERAGKQIDVDQVYESKRELQEHLVSKANPIASNLALLHLLRAARVKVGIASGSSRASVLQTMKLLNIAADAVVTADDVNRGKPHPDLFLLSASRLGVPPECCTVIEDSEAGIQAARSAGMRSFYFRDNNELEHAKGKASLSANRE